MLHNKANKVDLSSLDDQEKQLFQKYGQLPPKKNNLLLKTKERKYFDSGDYALAKAGKKDTEEVGTTVPNPTNIPHSSPSVTPISLSGTSPTNTISPISIGGAAANLNGGSASMPMPGSNPMSADHVGIGASPIKESRLSRQLDAADADYHYSDTSHPESGKLNPAT